MIVCPFNHTQICCCMFETSLNLLQLSSAIFTNLWKNYVLKSSANVQKPLSGLWTICGKSSEIFRKWLEISGKSQQTLLCILNILRKNKKSTCNLSSRVEEYFTHSLGSLLKHFSSLENKFCISSQPCTVWLYLLQCFY